MNFLYCYVKQINNTNRYYVDFNKAFALHYPENCLNIYDVNLFLFKKKVEECELIILPHHFVSLADRANEPLKVTSVVYPKNNFTLEMYKEYLEIVLNSDKPIIYLSYGIDLHNIGLSDKMIDLLSRKSLAMAWMFEKETVSWKNIPTAYQESWMNEIALSQFDIHKDPYENWLMMKKRFPTRIELPFAVGEQQFAKARKIWQTCIPGVSYATRNIALKSMMQYNLQISPYNFCDKVYLKAWSKLPKLDIINRFFIRTRQLSQHFFVSHSKLCFVCGSGIKYPVFKFFEIPAAHSLMLAYPFPGMDDYGFKDGLNVIYTLPEDAGKDAVNCLTNDKLMKKIITNASDLMCKNHKIFHRINNLLECCNHILKGTLKNAQFLNGKFEISTL